MINRQPTQETIADDIAAALALALAGKYRYLWGMKSPHWYQEGMGGHDRPPRAAIWQAMVASEAEPSEALATLIDERLRLALADWSTI